MQGLTFFRIMFDNLFLKNPLCRAIVSIVKFCNEQSIFGSKTLKFSQKMPFTKTEQTYNYKTKFIFDGKQASGVGLK